jgi:hypothetical protein
VEVVVEVVVFVVVVDRGGSGSGGGCWRLRLWQIQFLLNWGCQLSQNNGTVHYSIDSGSWCALAGVW